jgi:hypothetical protein
VVAKGEILRTVPRLRQFRLGEAQARERGEASRLQLGRFLVVGHVGDFLPEEIVLALGELRELLQPLVHLALLDLRELPCDLSDLLLLHVPQGVTGPVLARHALDVRQRLDVGELSRLLLLEHDEKLRQRGFVLLPCLIHRLLLGREALELVGGFVLTTEEVALP